MRANSEHTDQLIKGCRDGNAEAQFALYEQYSGAMFNTACRILKDRFEAEDAMQEAFLSCFDKMETYRGEVAFGAWLKKIVVNKSLTMLKQKQKKEEVELGKLEYKITDESYGGPGGIDEEETQEKVKMIVRAIQSLKENYRVALQLSLIEGYDNEEIAQILEISHENCRTTISRAKVKLKEILKESVFV